MFSQIAIMNSKDPINENLPVDYFKMHSIFPQLYRIDLQETVAEKIPIVTQPTMMKQLTMAKQVTQKKKKISSGLDLLNMTKSNKVSFEGESEKSHQLSEILDETSSIRTSNDSKMIHESGSFAPDQSPKKQEQV